MHEQEIDEMLANSLTLEDEEAVQAELQELQMVRFFYSRARALILTVWQEIIGVPTEAPVDISLPSPPTQQPVAIGMLMLILFNSSVS